ncbi:histone demethylase SWIRM1 [Datura stramonium]|uniref:Histone demethylase SWIRM1 n=1 Tax=Datura stramonium TaxID=4076 RepID=A0ABS8WJJ6_DATST|nr:histone demethylase SWIRM1 [Datura stramonium]
MPDDIVVAGLWTKTLQVVAHISRNTRAIPVDEELLSSDCQQSQMRQLAAVGMEMAQLICGGCRTLLMHPRGATSVRCACCHTVNLVPGPNQFAHVNCGNCRTMLMYPCGAPSVKCAICHYITHVNAVDGRVPVPVDTSNSGATSSAGSSSSTAVAHSQNQTVVVQNPMSLDESGKLVSNVVVGVTTTT